MLWDTPSPSPLSWMHPPPCQCCRYVPPLFLIISFFFFSSFFLSFLLTFLFSQQVHGTPLSPANTRGGNCFPFFTCARRAPSFAHKCEAHTGSSFFIFCFSFIDHSPSLPHALLLASSSRVTLALIGPHRVAFALSRRPRHITSVGSVVLPSSCIAHCHALPSPSSCRPCHVTSIASPCRITLIMHHPIAMRHPSLCCPHHVATVLSSLSCVALPLVVLPSVTNAWGHDSEQTLYRCL